MLAMSSDIYIPQQSQVAANQQTLSVSEEPRQGFNGDVQTFPSEQLGRSGDDEVNRPAVRPLSPKNDGDAFERQQDFLAESLEEIAVSDPGQDAHDDDYDSFWTKVDREYELWKERQ